MPGRGLCDLPEAALSAAADDDRRAITCLVLPWSGQPAGCDDVGLGVVAAKRGPLMAVLLQFGQYVRSDEPRCTGECHFHGRKASCLDRQNNASAATGSSVMPAPGPALAGPRRVVVRGGLVRWARSRGAATA